MKKGKRIISGILVAVTMSTMFAGCSVGKKEDNSKTKIVVWKNSGHDKAFLQKKFQEFNETIGKEKGIDLEYIVKEGDME